MAFSKRETYLKLETYPRLVPRLSGLQVSGKDGLHPSPTRRGSCARSRVVVSCTQGLSVIKEI